MMSQEPTGFGRQATERGCVSAWEQGRSTSLNERGLTRISHLLRTFRPNATGIPFPFGSHLCRVEDGYQLLHLLDHTEDRGLFAFQRARLELGLIIEAPLVVLLHRLERVLPWTHTSYAWPVSTSPEQTRHLVEAPWPDGQRLRLGLVIAEGRGGRVLAQREYQLDAPFSRVLHEAVRQQAITRFDGSAYVRAIAVLGLGVLSSAHLAEKLVARTIAIG